MHEETRPLSHIADAEREMKAARTLERFQEQVDGWMVNADGDDLCPEHVKTYRDKLAKLGLVAEFKPLRDLVEYRAKTRDHWFIMCSHENCRNEVTVPFE